MNYQQAMEEFDKPQEISHDLRSRIWYSFPKEWRISVYGITLTGVICAMGYASKHFGILSAIIAHFMIDVWLLRLLQREENTGQETLVADED